ncbi:MAG: TIGR03862 family flavoprotein [Caulobacter sp.]|nr:TIGR03862 family flavoprotein [Caulobacter sp.]
MRTIPRTVAIIGAGPAGLMAAETLAARGVAVTVHDRMASAGRKFLMAGRGGLNLTHSEPLDRFLSRYGAARNWLSPHIAALDPQALSAWAETLGQPLFTGSSGRVFPRVMKASPLLRAWLARLDAAGVRFALRSAWQGWSGDGALEFSGPDGDTIARPDATILSMGGASWSRLGSDGGWVPLLAARGVDVRPLSPSNVGVRLDWSATFSARFAGQPLKAIAISHGDRTVRGEALIAAYGLEGGAIYALSSDLRETMATGGAARITLDLKPDQSVGQLTGRIARPRGSQSLTNHLRKTAGLSPQAINLLREATGGSLPEGAGDLARLIKGVPFTLTGHEGLERAISSAGGVALESLDEHLMLKALPGVFAAGEMLDWEAPTGGYLLQACFATGAAAARGALRWMDEPSGD